MGGYGAYVWSAYAVTFVVLLLNVLYTRSAHKRQHQELLRDQSRRRQSQNQDQNQSQNQSVNSTAEVAGGAS